jgi:hypothetical protein
MTGRDAKNSPFIEIKLIKELACRLVAGGSIELSQIR